MTPNEARKIIYQEWIDYWSVIPSVPYAFDGESYSAEQEEWTHVTVQQLPLGGQYTLGPTGSRIFRREAVIRIQIYAAVNRGLQRLDELAKAARDLFEGKTISLVMFHDSQYLENGVEENWNKGTVNIFFTYDETK
jgi:hypothetical protein